MKIGEKTWLMKEGELESYQQEKMVYRTDVETQGMSGGTGGVIEEGESMMINPSGCYRPRDEFATPPTMARN